MIDAASRVADAAGLSGVSMRSVGRELDVEAMSLYHHVASKEALLDGLADWVFDRITTPSTRPRLAVRDAGAGPLGARGALRPPVGRSGLIESRRSPGPATLRHHDAVLGCLRSAGFSVSLAAHAFSVLDAYVFGFVLTEVNLPFEPGEAADEFVEGLALVEADHPHLAEMITEQVTGRAYSYGDEFDYGLELILDGLESRFVRPGS